MSVIDPLILKCFMCHETVHMSGAGLGALNPKPYIQFRSSGLVKQHKVNPHIEVCWECFKQNAPNDIIGDFESQISINNNDESATQPDIQSKTTPVDMTPSYNGKCLRCKIDKPISIERSLCKGCTNALRDRY